MSAAQWDGLPQNPDESGWHFIVRKGAPFPEVSSFPIYWASSDQCFEGIAGNAADAFRYIGPCLTPAEVAALVEQARREERDACANVCNGIAHNLYCDGDAAAMWAEACEEAIRARSAT